MDIFNWIELELLPQPGTSGDLIYNDVASQSGHSLPIIYQPFAPERRGHWRDRGAALDFLLATRSLGGRVLDFGPGDGWPSLIIAPRVAEVIGVEGSRRRVEVCRSNARRLGIDNAAFHYVEPGTPLPFADDGFDAVVAASSIEQTPDPRATMAELFRVLRPGGRLRIRYEALNRYRGERERGLWVFSLTNHQTRVILYNRHLAEETVEQIALTFVLDREALSKALTGEERRLRFDDVTPPGLLRLKEAGAILETRTLTTHHPSGTTWSRWMAEIGFSDICPTHDGIRIAGELFDRLPEASRPTTLESIDAYLQPILAVAVDLAAPLDLDPAITAVK
jgi:SAM-dependent methyltransferase